MSAVKIVGIVLIAAGILGLVYGGFSYTKETHEAKIGPIELNVKEKQNVNIPMWARHRCDSDRRRAAAWQARLIHRPRAPCRRAWARGVARATARITIGD